MEPQRYAFGSSPCLLSGPRSLEFAWSSTAQAVREALITSGTPHVLRTWGRAVGRLASLPTIVTWLILPVVICLSQRLSHACLSISNLYSETAIC